MVHPMKLLSPARRYSLARSSSIVRAGSGSAHVYLGKSPHVGAAAARLVASAAAAAGRTHYAMSVTTTTTAVGGGGALPTTTTRRDHHHRRDWHSQAVAKPGRVAGSLLYGDIVVGLLSNTNFFFRRDVYRGGSSGPPMMSMSLPPNDGGRTRAFGTAGSNVVVDDDDSGTASSDDNNQEIVSSSESGYIFKAEELLDRMRADAVSRGDKDGFPDIDSYTALMNAYVEEQRRLMSVIEEERRSEIKYDAANATIPNDDEHGDVESNERGAVKIMALAEKCHELLIQMEDISGVSDHYSSMRLSGGIRTELRNSALRPTSHHYDAVISAFADAAVAARDANHATHVTKNAPFVAQRWLQRMETLAFDPHSGVAPTVDSYFHVMEACSCAAGGGAGAAGDGDDDAAASASAVGKRRRSNVPVAVHAVFEKLRENTNIRPTAREYRLLLRTWCGVSGLGHKNAAYEAMGMWMSMQRDFRGGDDEMEPTLEDGKMALEAWTRSINKRSANRALTILHTMEILHASKKTNVQPDLDCYRYALITMSRSKVPDIGSSIPKLFKSMEDNHIFPDTSCFDASIETLKNCARYSNDKEAEMYAKAAENMLERMEKERERSSTSVVKPSSVTYTNVIQVLAARKLVKAAEKADVFLTKMEREFANGDESMQPTRDSYVGVIHAFGESRSENNFLRADEFLQRMIAQHSQGNEAASPDVNSFHAVIRACARATETPASPKKQKEALLLAISTVQYMKKSDSNHPNARTYLLLMQCCTGLLPDGPERERAIRSIFRSCCKDGMVSQRVLKEFQGAVASETYHREVVRDAPWYNGAKSLPEKWTRGLGYSVRTHETEDGVRKRNPIISVSGEVIASTAFNDHRMRRRRSKKNQKLLRGGRI